MSTMIITTLSAAFASARKTFEAHSVWPDPASGLAYRMFSQTGMEPPAFVAQPLKSTSLTLLRRTPELAAFGYLAERLDDATMKLWVEGFEHLRGRQFYPADRQSFVFNPIEILGIATGLSLCRNVTDETREWFGGAIRKGLAEGQFRSPLPKVAAFVALSCVGQIKGGEGSPPTIDLAFLDTPELLLTSAMGLAFNLTLPTPLEIERAILSHILSDSILIGDVAEAAAMSITLRRIIDKIALGSYSDSPVDRILVLCRRFPLFVEQLQRRQRGRTHLSIDDEYDVQDFLHAILKLHFDDVRPEEHTPSYGGTSS